MSIMATQPEWTGKNQIMVSPTEKANLQTAAPSVDCSLRDLVVESALACAEDALADRRVFYLDAERWMAFQSALDKPIRPLPRLKALLEAPGFFDEGMGMRIGT
jgi:uncharacterized protein (DUF1778 family)